MRAPFLDTMMEQQSELLPSKYRECFSCKEPLDPAGDHEFWFRENDGSTDYLLACDKPDCQRRRRILEEW